MLVDKIMDFMNSLFKESRKGVSMESRTCTLKVIILAAIASCVICTSPNSLTSDSKCTSEASSKVCLACADANIGITEADCCEEADTHNLCEDLVNNGNDVEKRAKYFLGKRARNNFLGKRPRNNFLGKRGYLDQDMSDIGKIDGLDTISEDRRSLSPFLGKRVGQADSEEKRRQNPFLGKRSRMTFLGKRKSPFLGKRDDHEMDEDKRQAPFLGKRSVDDDDFTEDEYLGEEKRSTPFLGKRGASPFLGKRDQLLGRMYRSPFLGKRGAYDGLEAEEKRAKYFLGKRNDGLNDEDMESLVKRAKYFLGKRPKYFLG